MLMPSVPQLGDSGSLVYENAIMASHPLAYWKMQDASGLPADSSGNGFNTTGGSANAYRQTGQPNLGDYSILYSGGTGHTRAPQVSNVIDDFTMEAWMMPQVVANNSQIFIYNGNAASSGWGIIFNLNGKFQYICGGLATGSESNIAPASTLFSHIVVVRRATVWEYYINGAVDTANAGTTTPGGPNGTTKWGDGSIQFKASHIALYETPLSAADILAHYQARLGLAVYGTSRPAGMRRRAGW